MTLSSYDQMLFSPLGNGYGNYWYDFETMYTSIDAYPYRLQGVESDDKRIIFPPAVTNYIHESLHHHQHLGTTVGQYQALCRHKRIGLCLDALNHGDRNAINLRAFSPNKVRRPLLDRWELPALRKLSRDPLAPTIGYPFRLHWYQTLAGEKFFLMASALSEVDKEFCNQNMALSFLEVDSFWHVYHHRDSEAFTPAEVYSQALSGPLTLVNYTDGHYRRSLDTINLMENLCSIWEICFLFIISPELASLRFTDAEKSNYLVATRYALRAMGKDFLPFNVHKYAPELSLITELSLNPPLPPFLLSSPTPISWVDIYPPVRFASLVQAACRIGHHLELGSHSSKDIQDRADIVSNEANVPVAFVGNEPAADDGYRDVKSLMSHAAGPEGRHLKMGELTWIKWYFWLQDMYIRRTLAGRRFITDTLLNAIVGGSCESWEPPVILDAEKNNLLADYLRKNRHGALLFALENLQTYMTHDIMLGRGDITPLPFDIDESVFCRWGLIGEGQYQQLVDRRLGLG